MSLEYKILGQDLVSYTTTEEIVDTTSYYVGYEETSSPILLNLKLYFNDIEYSTDNGLSWTSVPLGTSGFVAWEGLAFGGGIFLATASSRNVVSRSTDGKVWQAGVLPFITKSSVSGIVYAENKFVAITSANQFATSQDSLTWQIVATVPTLSANGINIGSFTYLNGLYILTAQESGGALDAKYYISSSTDLVNWSTQTFSGEVTTGINSNQISIRSVVYVDNIKSNGQSAYVGLLNIIPSSLTRYIVRSSDGISWSVIQSFPNDERGTLAAGAGLLVLATDNVDSYLLVSQNGGDNWSKVLPSSFSGYSDLGPYDDLIFYDNRFVAVRNTANVPALYSTDLDWGFIWQDGVGPVGGGPGIKKLGGGITTTLTETLNIIGGQGTSTTEEFLPVTFYTVPEGKQTTVTSVYVANHDESESTYDFAVVPAGEELSLKHHIRWDMPVAGKDFEVINTKITMSAGDKLVIFPSTVDTVSVTAFGVEK